MTSYYRTLVRRWMRESGVIRHRILAEKMAGYKKWLADYMRRPWRRKVEQQERHREDAR
jgi:hypothetical protein